MPANYRHLCPDASRRLLSDGSGRARAAIRGPETDPETDAEMDAETDTEIDAETPQSTTR